jgi:Domain of Unknown Function (DUF1080)
MKSIFFVFPLSVLMAATPYLSERRDPLSLREKKQGWVSLFDGRTTNGWHSYGMGQVDPLWSVQDGVLHLKESTRKEHGDLLSNEIYGDFDLKLEWKISPGGNSGILFYVQDDKAKYKETYWTGPEMQILDNNGHPDGKIPKHHAGDLYDLVACSRETVKPVGEWNRAEVYSRGGKLNLYLNGVNVVSTTLWDDQWRTMIAGSKFRQWPDFGTFHNGHIDLQDHGFEAWFRNIKIRKF